MLACQQWISASTWDAILGVVAVGAIGALALVVGGVVAVGTLVTAALSRR